MNLFFRLIWTWLFSSRRATVDLLGPCLTPYRCWPTDIDVLRHMNNGIYLSLMDIARVDLMTRAGVLNKISAQGWYPVVVAETIRFRKSIELFDKFSIETRVLGWDEKAFVLEQRFLRRDVSVAEALVRARFLKKSGGSVTPLEIVALANYEGPMPTLSKWVNEWNQMQSQ